MYIKENHLIKNTSQQNQDLGFTFSYAYPEGTRIDREIQIELNPAQHYSEDVDTVFVILYIYSGEGKFFSQNIEEEISKGDRLTISNISEIKILNSGETPLIFSVTFLVHT